MSENRKDMIPETEEDIIVTTRRQVYYKAYVER